MEAHGTAPDITELLRAWSGGDPAALDRLVPLVYGELHRLAHRYLGREQSNDMLQTTALVHEAYIRLVDAQRVGWKDRVHFFAISANLMRRILVEFARTRASLKRGGGMSVMPLDEAAVASPAPKPGFAALDEALEALAAIDARQGRIVELRFFGGLTEDEIATELGISPDTVMRDWKHAKAWLLRELKSNRGHAS